MATETPKYQVVEQHPGFEIRQYPDLVVAETEVEGSLESVGNEAFSRLAGYIFGKNRGSRKIAMTAPVTQTSSEGEKIPMTAPVTQAPAGDQRWRVQFMMPSQYRLETLPEPIDPRVHLHEVGARRFAVLRYSGTWSERNFRDHLRTLQVAMADEKIDPAGAPEWARYDPPFKPWFMRTNEILIPVQ